MRTAHHSHHLKTGSQDLALDLALRSPVTLLHGVSDAAATALKSLDIHSIFDLAHSRIFHNAHQLAFPSDRAVLRETLLIASDVVDNAALQDGSTQAWGDRPIVHLHGIGPVNQGPLADALSVRTIRDLALWPPYLAAREVAGHAHETERAYIDEGVPQELVPRFDEYASEKSFYSVYVMDAGNARTRTPRQLSGAIALHDVDLLRGADQVRTGAILRYEQSWTPVALTLGNLLHSLALAPGESTRIAMIDWSRRQGVRTSEDITQLEALSNSMMQTRSISEVTRAVAREAQSGFSSMNSNSTVGNTAYSSYGLQNAEQALAATAAGAMGGGAAGALGGGVAGGGIGIIAGGVTGGFGAGIGAVPGMILGGIVGGGIGAGAGGLVGATAGGVTGFLGTAEFGAGQGSGSTATVDAVTTTSSTGTRDVAAEMAQNIDDRTHQHASTSRNRHAAIVQEVSQQETEQISTRVVTNYNHMYALTIQYFEVVQVYNVRTTLVQKQDCLYIPFQPIEWTPQLIALCRPILLRAALTLEMVHSLLSTEKTVLMRSPTYAAVSEERRRQLRPNAMDKLREARVMLNGFVSADPLDGWRVPDHYRLVFVWHFFDYGPFWGATQQGQNISYQLTLHYLDGSQARLHSHNDLNALPAAQRRIGTISHITLRISSATFDFAAALPEPAVYSMGLVLTDNPDSDQWEEAYSSITFRAHFVIEPGHIQGQSVELPVLVLSKTMAMNALVEHLNENSEHYTQHVLHSKGNPLVRRVLTHYAFGDKPLMNLVDQEPVAITGNSLVFLLHEAIGDGGRASDRYKVRDVASSSLVPVGTGGVFAEAVQGRANAAEKLDITRFWNWQESPIPIVAPEIAPIQAGSRAMQADVRPGSLDPATVQMMSPQALPTPQGLPAALTAVSTQMFRDMSGIAQTAQLAQQALEQAMLGATTTGEQSSQNLQQGMNLTKELLGKVVDMNSQFANTLVESGFGAMGMAMGGAGGAGAPGGGTVGGTGGGLMHKGPSQIGALMNSAAKLDARPGGSGGAAAGGAVGAVGAAGASSGASGGAAGGGSGGTTGGGAVGAFLTGTPGRNLQQQVLEHAAGLPPGGAASAGPAGVATPVPSTPGVPPAADNPWAQRLGPALAQAATSDDAYDQAMQTLMQEVEQAALADQSPWPLYEYAFQSLPHAWARSVDRAVARVNGGQAEGLARLDKLLSDAEVFPALHGSTAPAEVLGRLDIALAFTDLQAPAFSDGGVPVAVSGRLMQRLPQGEWLPVADAAVRLYAPATTEQELVVQTDAQGRFTLTVTHGVPDPDFVGVSRFAGLVDLRLFLSAHSPLSPLVSAQQEVLVPGRLVVRLASAVYADSGDDARSHPANNIVLAAAGQTIWMHFAVTKGGQKLMQQPLSGPPTLNGAGHIESYTVSTMHDGLISVIYDPLGADSGVAYLAVQIASSDGQVAAARADLQFS